MVTPLGTQYFNAEGENISGKIRDSSLAFLVGVVLLVAPAVAVGVFLLICSFFYFFGLKITPFEEKRSWAKKEKDVLALVAQRPHRDATRLVSLECGYKEKEPRKAQTIL